VNNIDDLDSALAVLISSTKRKKRPFSISDVANAIEVACSHLGSLAEVGERIGLSVTMLSQFLQVRKLSEKLLGMVANRSIDSVDMVNHFANMTHQEQDAIATMVNEHGWNTNDIRDYVGIRKNDKDSSVDDLIKQVEKSRTVKHYVVECVARGGISPFEVRSRLRVYIENDQIIFIDVMGSVVSVTFSKLGYEEYKLQAKNEQVSKGELLPKILYENGV